MYLIMTVRRVFDRKAERWKFTAPPPVHFIHALRYGNLAENLMVTGYGKQS
jgi:hypothetical protein